MVRYFNTMMKKQTGMSGSYEDAGKILKKIASLSSREKPVIIEYSMADADLVKAVFEGAGHKHCRTISAKYSNNLPFAIVVFNCEALNDAEEGRVDKYYIQKLASEGYKSVFDPTAGIGHTAGIVIKAGMAYIGSEINPARAKRCSELIKSLTHVH